MTPLDYEEEAEDTVAIQRALQAERRQTDKKTPEDKPKSAMQAGARRYPEPPLPMQTLDKPGNEADMVLQPLYDAPYYRGSGKLEGKVALITGGDSGIGRSVAIFYAREGADVAIVFLDEHEDAELTRSLVEAEGQRCLLIAGDVADRQFCRDAVAQTVARLGKLDILVNNAAFQLHAKFADLSEEQFDRTLKTNLYGYFHMAQAAAEHIPNGGAIVNTGSVTGIEGSPMLIDYSMTKGGIHAFTRSLAGQLVEKGIRVNCVAPGPVWTPLNPADKSPDDVAQFGAQTPMKRPAQPEEIAPAYVFLASPQMSSYITGEVLPVIGGYGGG
ncbi:SDR family oxidoreductase [Asticcacaulis sp. 201]|uniref:SDR family oxidoreductase n=1 Tax=Asticcacaulis sp. 201 TaxID=3028787 RepID=UPI0029162040|nr:SDR family oxidoreductase [Asticcacaulis sp. 201]MDV6331650.1 SDR family oxidoreductase [Asticcacaulis sp. 201]